MKRILILGGSGFVGRHLRQRLAADGLAVTIPTRQTLPSSAPAEPGVRWVQANVLDPHQLNDLVRGHDTVINLLAILHGNAAAFEQLHVEFPKALATCCAAWGVQHLIHVSAIGADSRGPSMYQRSKGRGEEALQRIQGESGLPISVLRPSVIFGEDDQFLNMFARLQRLAPFMPLAGASTRFQPVWVDDVAQALARLATGPRPTYRLMEACGPQTFTLAELVRHAGRWAGCQRPVMPLPLAVGKLQAWLMEYLPGKTLMSRDNIDSLRADNVASGLWPDLSDLGIPPAALASVFKHD